MKYRIKEVVGDKWLLPLLSLYKYTFEVKSAPWPGLADRWWWIAFTENDDPAGFASLRKSKQYVNCGYLERCGVLEEYRGQGLQMRFIRARELKARKLGFEWMRSDTTEASPSANHLARAGYQIYDPEDPYAYKNTIYWRKKL